MKRILAAGLIALCAIAVQPARGADAAADANDLKALRAAAKADKKGLVASTLALTPAEAKKFWPLYDAYQRGLDLANRQRAVALEGLVARDKPMSNLYAKQLAVELIAADELELKARRKLQNAVIRALPPLKAARYMQLEGKIRAVQANDIAENFPLIK